MWKFSIHFSINFIKEGKVSSLVTLRYLDLYNEESPAQRWDDGAQEGGERTEKVALTHIYTIMCKIDSAKLLNNTGNLAWQSMMIQGLGWGEEKEAREERDIHT